MERACDVIRVVSCRIIRDGEPDHEKAPEHHRRPSRRTSRRPSKPIHSATRRLRTISTNSHERSPSPELRTRRSDRPHHSHIRSRAIANKSPPGQYQATRCQRTRNLERRRQPLPNPKRPLGRSNPGGRCGARTPACRVDTHVDTLFPKATLLESEAALRYTNPRLPTTICSIIQNDRKLAQAGGL